MHGEDIKEKENKAGNPLFIIIIFAVLLGFLFFIPDIYKRFKPEISDFLGIGVHEKEPGDKADENDNKEAVSAHVQIGSWEELEFNEIKVSNVSLEGNTLSMTVTTPETINLENARYYVEFFQNKRTFIGRRILKGEVTKSLDIEIDVTGLGVDTVTYMALSHVDDNAIQPLEVTTDESGLYNLVCTKDTESYEYEFNLNKLSKVKYKYTYTTSNLEEYANKVLEYQKLAKKYDEYTGVSSSIAEETGSFLFLCEFDYSRTSNFSRIGDNRLFVRDEPVNIVKFRMEAEGFDCE